MAYENLLLSDKGQTRLITINRIKVHNALNKRVLLELRQVFLDLEQNTGIRAAIITGGGEKSFVAGADINEMKSFSPMEAESFSALGQEVFDLIESSRVPVAAAVNGYALGGGLELALACDFIYASENASLGLVETKLGLIPGFGGIARLAQRVGIAQAKEMIFSASPLGSSEALRIGLVNQVIPDGDVVAVAKSIMDKIAQRGPLAISASKKLLNQALGYHLKSIDNLERSHFGLMFSSKDAKEGISAFMDKRIPAFEGQ